MTLFKAANLTRTLTEGDLRLPARPQLVAIKIAPRDVTIIAATTTVIVDWKVRWLEVVTPAIPTIGGTFAPSRVEPNVVQQIAAKAAKASHASLQAIAYMSTVPNPISHKIEWAIYMNDHRYFLANLNGTDFHAGGRAGASPVTAPATSPSGTPAGGTVGGATTNTQTIVTCIQHAASDPAKIAACTGR